MLDSARIGRRTFVATLFTVMTAGCALFCANDATGQSDGWITVDRQYFSFKYPPGWKLDEKSGEQGSIVSVVEPGQQRGLMVTFQPGFTNQPGILNQCASVDEYLDRYYQVQYAPLATGTGQYPYTTVTHDDFQPGWLGGRSTTVTIVHVEAYQNPMMKVVYVNAVPRADGIYLVVYLHPSESMEVSEPFRQNFLRSIQFKSRPLDSNANCNYLSK